MSVTEAFVRHIGYRFWLAYKGESAILSWFRKFKPLWRADRQALAGLQLQSLRAILSHAGKTSPYYAELFGRHGFEPEKVTSLSDLGQLPFLTKEILNQNMERVLSTRYKKDDLIVSSTGGSSGLSLTFYRDKRARAVRRAQDLFFNNLLGIDAGVKRAWVWGSPLDAVTARSLKARVSNFLSDRAIYFDSYDATPVSMGLFIQQLNRHRPKVILAYPNMLATLAQYAQERRIEVVPVEKVVVTAEPLYEWQRQIFREVFQAETFERYGAREFGTAASECQEHCGMHLFEPAYYVEVIDERGKPLPPGEMGELVVTDFYNYAMPLIRYRTGDMAKIDTSPCRCGCNWQRIVAIGGRIIDMVVRPDGSKVAGELIVNSIHTSGIRAKVQVVQTSPSSLTVRHLAGDSVPSDAQTRFKEKIEQAFAAPVEVKYEAVDNLSYDKSGKYRYIINEYDRSGNRVS